MTPPIPPAEVHDCVDRWWRRLKQPAEWSGAVSVGPEPDPQGNLWWMWVPGAAWLDEKRGYFRVQCFFRIFRDESPPRLECDEFRTVQSMSPSDADRADGMG